MYSYRANIMHNIIHKLIEEFAGYPNQKLFLVDIVMFATVWSLYAVLIGFAMFEWKVS